MPREAFEVIVGVSGEAGSELVAAVAAGRYLAYADQTDTFGYLSEIVHVSVTGPSDHSADAGDYGVLIQFTAPIENDEARERFFYELDQLSRVEVYEQLAWEPA